jgi:S1-C subfamily serine protease
LDQFFRLPPEEARPILEQYGRRLLEELRTTNPSRTPPSTAAPPVKPLTDRKGPWELFRPLLPAWAGERPPRPSRFHTQALTPVEIFRTISPSVYLVIAGKTKSAMTTEGGSRAIGSAVAVSASAALTNCHVMKDHKFVMLLDSKRDQILPASLAHAHEDTDRCILRVRGSLNPIAGVRPITGLAEGERVYTIGNPSGLSNSLGEGLISGLRRRGGITYVQTSAPISRGSSGGALVDAKGALVGVTTFFVQDAQNLNFAIAAEEFWRR